MILNFIHKKMKIKHHVDKKPDDAFLDSLHYDNTPSRNPDNTEMTYDNKKHDLSSGQYRAQAQSRKKTDPDPPNPGILGKTGQKNNPKRGGGFRDITAHRKKVHPHDRGGNKLFGCTGQL